MNFIVFRPDPVPISSECARCCLPGRYHYFEQSEMIRKIFLDKAVR